MIQIDFMDIFNAGLLIVAIIAACRAHFYKGKAMYYKVVYDAKCDFLQKLEAAEQRLNEEALTEKK